MLHKYVVKDEYPKDVNPKVIRTILWRTITNMTKHKESQDLIKDNLSNIIVSAVETLQKAKSDSTIINSCVMALNNIFFIEVRSV